MLRDPGRAGRDGRARPATRRRGPVHRWTDRSRALRPPERTAASPASRPVAAHRRPGPDLRRRRGAAAARSVPGVRPGGRAAEAGLPARGGPAGRRVPRGWHRSRCSTAPAGSTCGRCPGWSARCARDRTDVVLVAHHNRAALALGPARGAAGRGAQRGRRARHGPHPRGRSGAAPPRVETLFLSDALVLLAPSQGDYLHERGGRWPVPVAPDPRGGDPERDRRRPPPRPGRPGEARRRARAGRRPTWSSASWPG